MADEGVSYFPLFCVLDEKFELIEAEFGIKGFAVVVKLYQRIYKEHGYYCEWNEDISLVFAKQCGFSNIGDRGTLDCADRSAQPGKPRNLIDLVVAASIRRGIFDRQLFEKHSILTSHGIQKNFLNIVRNRKKVEVKKAYLLLSDAEIKGNVVIIEESYVRKDESYVRPKQSKGKDSKVKYKNTMRIAEANALFEKVWKLYPMKKGKGKVSDMKKLELLEIGFDHMERAIGRYVKFVKRSDYLHYQYGSTFFNGGYVDYLDANYTDDSTGQRNPSSRRNSFHNFPQRDYDLSGIEKQLLNGGFGK